MRFRVIAGLFLSLAALSATPRAGQALEPPFAGPLVDLAPPPQPGATLPNLAVDSRGRVWLSWLEPRQGGGHRFQVSSFDSSRQMLSPDHITEIEIAVTQNRLILPLTGDYQGTDHVLGHELVHVFQYDIASAPEDTIPWVNPTTV
jgi:hypothetical protein